MLLNVMLFYTILPNSGSVLLHEQYTSHTCTFTYKYNIYYCMGLLWQFFFILYVTQCRGYITHPKSKKEKNTKLQNKTKPRQSFCDYIADFILNNNSKLSCILFKLKQ